VVDITCTIDKLGQLAKYAQRIWHGAQGGDICNDIALREVDGEEVRGSCGFEWTTKKAMLTRVESCTPLMDYQSDKIVRSVQIGINCYKPAYLIQGSARSMITSS
jgi:hypothetical protein